MTQTSTINPFFFSGFFKIWLEFCYMWLKTLITVIPVESWFAGWEILIKIGSIRNEKHKMLTDKKNYIYNLFLHHLSVNFVFQSSQRQQLLKNSKPDLNLLVSRPANSSKTNTLTWPTFCVYWGKGLSLTLQGSDLILSLLASYFILKNN